MYACSYSRSCQQVGSQVFVSVQTKLNIRNFPSILKVLCWYFPKYWMQDPKSCPPDEILTRNKCLPRAQSIFLFANIQFLFDHVMMQKGIGLGIVFHELPLVSSHGRKFPNLFSGLSRTARCPTVAVSSPSRIALSPSVRGLLVWWLGATWLGGRRPRWCWSDWMVPPFFRTTPKGRTYWISGPLNWLLSIKLLFRDFFFF